MDTYTKWIAIACLLTLFMGCPAKPPVEEVPPSLELLKLAELRNHGLAYVENEALNESQRDFAKLVELLPDELMPARNQAVSWTLALQGVDRSKPEVIEATKAGFRAAIKKLKSLDKSEVPMLLSAAGWESLEETELAIAELQEAVKRAPDDPSGWFQLHKLAKISADSTTQSISHDAIQQAYKLAPSNLVILISVLISQAEREDAQIVETLADSEELLSKLAPGLKKRVRVDISPYLNAAKASASENNWPLVQRNVNILNNVIQPDDAAQSDRQRIEKHPLEYVLEEFSPKIETEIQKLQADEVSSINVTFDPLAIDLDGEREIFAAKFADFLLTGEVQLCLLLDEEIQILSTGNDWDRLANAPVSSGYSKLAIADLENDADDKLIPEGQKDKVCHTTDLEVLAYGEAGIALFQSQLTLIGGELSLVAFELQGEVTNLKNVQQVEISDINNDGDLDLVVLADSRLSLWSNRGELLFEKIEATWELDEPVIDLTPIDFDQDVDTDLVLLLESGAIGYLENLRHGTFRWQSLDITPQDFQASHLEVLDYDRDGAWDFLIANELDTRILTPSASSRKELRPEFGSMKPIVEIRDWEFNNDGYRDLVLISKDELEIQQGTGDNRQGNGSSIQFGSEEELRGFDFADIDSDGDDDLLVFGDKSAVIQINNGGNKNHWIDVELLAAQLTRDGTTASGRVNQYGIGCVIEVRAGASYQKVPVTRQKTRLGLGKHQSADAIRILWTNGVPANVIDPKADQLICERQSLKGSCPYLYAWNGEEFVFVTDLLWASPIGLQNAHGELVPARNWEYLKVDGDKLQPQNGHYELQVTEELWEVAYFDQVELIAVDHPSDIEFFSNEKVGPPSLAEYKLHSVKDKRYPISVTNQSGKDLLPAVSLRDERYAKPFDSKLRQGYTSDSWLEIDLGLKSKPEKLKLYLTGWIYPTDTSINVALNENPSLPGPRPPSLSVPNESGEFVEVVPFTGFPGGKTKTIVLELTDVFLSDDYRLRLSTSSELYWDEIFFTIGEDSVDPQSQNKQVVVTPLQLSSAHLHDRGVSRKIEHPQFGPESYDYSSIDSTPPWPVIHGHFTRYGDVLPLIEKADDRMVLMGAGDEMTLKFSVPEKPLPQGWKRDFILHNVGWDKDADLHTLYGTTVAPLPFRKMQSYPYAQTEEFPSDDIHTRDSQEFHTRTLNPVRFHNAMRRPVP